MADQHAPPYDRSLAAAATALAVVARRMSQCLPRCVLLSTLLTVAGCSPTIDDESPATRAQCERLYAHLVDLQLGVGPGAADTLPDDLAQHRTNLMGVASDAFFEHCEVNRTQAYIHCALSSKTLDDYRACDVTAHAPSAHQEE